MREFHRLIVLSAVAVILVIGIGVCIVINPLISASLTGALLAVAAIIRAIAGSPAEPPDRAPLEPPTQEHPRSPSP